MPHVRTTDLWYSECSACPLLVVLHVRVSVRVSMSQCVWAQMGWTNCMFVFVSRYGVYARVYSTVYMCKCINVHAHGCTKLCVCSGAQYICAQACHTNTCIYVRCKYTWECCNMSTYVQ